MPRTSWGMAPGHSQGSQLAPLCQHQIMAEMISFSCSLSAEPCVKNWAASPLILPQPCEVVLPSLSDEELRLTAAK